MTLNYSSSGQMRQSEEWELYSAKWMTAVKRDQLPSTPGSCFRGSRDTQWFARRGGGLAAGGKSGL